MSRRLAAAVSGSACAAAFALAGCAASTPSSPATSAPATSAPAVTATPAPATPAPATPAPATPAATTSPRGPAATAPGYLTVTIGGLPTHPTLAFGGEPLQFTVTLRNATDHPYRDITPLVSIGHSTANTSPVEIGPQGTLAELDPATGTWRPVFYDREGTGMDYIMANIVQQPALTLNPGASVTFTFKMAFSADQGPLWRSSGQTPIDVTVIQLPGRTWIGNRPAASVPVTTITGH
jgi:hypothetical protein